MVRVFKMINKKGGSISNKFTYDKLYMYNLTKFVFIKMPCTFYSCRYPVKCYLWSDHTKLFFLQQFNRCIFYE